MKVSQHVFILPCFPEILNGVGQLLFPEESQFLFLLWRERHVGHRATRVNGGSLWMETENNSGDQCDKKQILKIRLRKKIHVVEKRKKLAEVGRKQKENILNKGSTTST